MCRLQKKPKTNEQGIELIPILSKTTLSTQIQVLYDIIYYKLKRLPIFSTELIKYARHLT